MSDYYSQTIDYGPLFRAQDPPTSKAAGVAAAEFVASHEAQILEALQLGPAHRDLIAARAGMERSEVWRRLAAMERRGLIEKTGRQCCGDSGMRQAEWRAKASDADRRTFMEEIRHGR
jgi:predicted Rossmann fold nucleotide-binding protein DprA/Smf involved in DNA uptake